jgi:hypothetical protein
MAAPGGISGGRSITKFSAAFFGFEVSTKYPGSSGTIRTVRHRRLITSGKGTVPACRILSNDGFFLACCARKTAACSSGSNNVKFVTNFSCELPEQRLNISSCVCHDKGSF